MAYRPLIWWVYYRPVRGPGAGQWAIKKFDNERDALTFKQQKEDQNYETEISKRVKLEMPHG